MPFVFLIAMHVCALCMYAENIKIKNPSLLPFISFTFLTVHLLLSIRLSPTCNHPDCPVCPWLFSIVCVSLVHFSRFIGSLWTYGCYCCCIVGGLNSGRWHNKLKPIVLFNCRKYNTPNTQKAETYHCPFVARRSHRCDSNGTYINKTENTVQNK